MLSFGSCKMNNKNASEMMGEPCSNPAAILRTDAQKAMVATLRDVASGHLYTMDYDADYMLDKLMEQGGARSNEEMTGFIAGNLLELPALDSMFASFGCSGFCAKSPDGDVLVGRNFDYRFTSSANLMIRDNASKGHKSLGIAALPFLSPETYVAGALSDGTTDVSLPAVASVYCCMDGMNDAGLFIAVLSLRGGGASQHDPSKKNVLPPVAIRLVLDGCKTVDEAVEVFRSHNFFADGEDSPANYHFLIADATGKSRVVEYWRPGEEAPVADPKAKDWTMNVIEADHVTNFYLTEPWSNLGVGQDRYKTLHSTLDSKNRVLTEDECMDLLKAVHSDLNPGEVTSNTQWSVVYNLTRRTATVCVDKDYTNPLHFSL